MKKPMQACEHCGILADRFQDAGLDTSLTVTVSGSPHDIEIHVRHGVICNSRVHRARAAAAGLVCVGEIPKFWEDALRAAQAPMVKYLRITENEHGRTVLVQRPLERTPTRDQSHRARANLPLYDVCVEPALASLLSDRSRSEVAEAFESESAAQLVPVIIAARGGMTEERREAVVAAIGLGGLNGLALMDLEG